MKRLYLIPSKVLCIKPRNKNTYIHCSKKNLIESLSGYDIKVTGDTNYRFVELPEGWDVQDEKKRAYLFC